MAEVRLVTRGDDSGMCHSANVAVMEAFGKGILRNTSLMVPCPAFDEAAEMFAGAPGLCVGLHATVTAEWDRLRWGPVLPAGEVPTLVDEHGHLFQTTQDLDRRAADPDQMMAEIQAQLDLARDRGVRIAYVDTHMGFGWVDDMDERVAALAEREGLIYRPGGLSRLPRPEGDFEDPLDGVVARLEAAGPGTYLIVGHPGYDNEEMAQLGHGEYGKVGQQRDVQRRMFTDQKVLDCCARRGIEPIRYTEI